MASRVDGYYWVRITLGHRWCVAQWMGDCWLFPGSDEELRDEEVAQVDPNRIVRAARLGED